MYLNVTFSFGAAICQSVTKNYYKHILTWILWYLRTIQYILRRNCLLKQIIEGKIKGQIEVTRRRGRRRKKLLDDLKDGRGYCQLKEESLDRTTCRNPFGRGFRPIVWQITDDDDSPSKFNFWFLRQRSWKTLELCGVAKFSALQDYGTVSLGK